MHALSLLGLRPSKNLLITVGTRAAVQARQSKLINQNSFWNAALQKALFAQEVAALLKTDPDLDPLRPDPRFRAIIRQAEARPPKP